MGANQQASSFAEPARRLRRVGGALLAVLAFAASACTAAGEYEPTLVGTQRGAAGAAGSSPSINGRPAAGSPMAPAPVLAPAEGASAVDLFPGDGIDDNGGGARTGSGDRLRDGGLELADAGDGGDAAPVDAGGDVPPSPDDASTPPAQDAGAPASLDASAPPGEHDASTPPPEPPCPGLTFEGSCYEFFDEQVSWNEAEARCIAWGGHLASVESSVEDAFIGAWPALLGVPLLEGSGLWLGGTDALEDGNFRWSDDRALTFLGWAAAQPNNGAGVDCIEKRNDFTQSWYDRRCTDGERYVCERPD